MYNFERVVDRWNQGSAKWEIMKTVMGNKADGMLAISVADMDFEMAPEIITAIHDAADNLVYGYSSPPPDYFEAVISWMQRRHHWTIEKESIASAPGIVSAIYYLLYALTKPGDGVIIQSPVYTPFARTITHTGRQVLNNALINQDGRYMIDFDDFEKKAALDEAKVFLFCSPHNPVGRLWKPEELEQLAFICAKHDVFIISDEIHFDLVFPPNRHDVLANLTKNIRDRCITCTSPSKTFNIAGLQISNIIISNESIRKKYVEAALSCGFHLHNCFAYPACIAAYNKAEAWLDACIEYLRENLQFVKHEINQHLPQIIVTPLEATYLMWLDCRALGLDHMALQKLMREKGRLFFDDGFIFGKEGEQFLRFNIAYPRSIITEVLLRMRNAIRNNTET